MSQPGDTSSTGSLRKVLVLRTLVLCTLYEENCELNIQIRPPMLSNNRTIEF